MALTLPGHAGGAPLGDGFSAAAVTDAVERELDAIGWERAHLVGNSLGGFVALELAARHRGRTVVALAPAGGWDRQDRSVQDLLSQQREVYRLAKQAAPHAELVLASPQGRRRATQLITVNYKHIPAELLVHQLRGMAACDAAEPMIEQARQVDWTIDAQRIDCPVRVVWGTDDRLLPWPAAARRFRHDWLPHADWVVLDGAGHCPQLDLPLEAAQLVLGFTS